MSGPGAIRIAGAVFKGKARPEEMASHVLHKGEIRDPDADALVDSVLLTVMRGPNSYTGEDMVEIYGHGGPVVLAETLGLLFRKGAVPARPGEFSRRAFLNGRMDLSEAEAVLDLIRARTKEAAHSAVLGLRGKRREMLESLRSEVLSLLAMVEASIDFPEDETVLDRQSVIQRIRHIRERVDHLVETGTRGKLMRTGLTVAIVGKPNVGKSSLLNALLEEERAIVTPVPGTTRDYLAEWIDVAGIPVRLIDTAGLRETESSVEMHGVSRARKAIEESDFVLVLLDWSCEMTEEDEEVLRAVGDRRKIVLLNKCDLDRVLDTSQLEGWLPVSAKYGDGLDKLLEQLELLVWEGKAPMEDAVFTRARHLASLRDLDQHLQKSADLLQSGRTEEIIAIELRDGLFSIAQIAGETTTDEILDTIFSEFCIGK
jgi:tRNA modification GTPase